MDFDIPMEFTSDMKYFIWIILSCLTQVIGKWHLKNKSYLNFFLIICLVEIICLVVFIIAFLYYKEMF